MNPNEKAEQARELFLSGHNCAQSVYAAFAEDMGMSREKALLLSGGLGGGLGGLRFTCGAFTAMAMVLSALMTPCAGGPHRSSVFVTVLEYLLMLIPLVGYLASVSVLAVRSVKALRRGGSRGMLWAGLGLTLLGIVYLALYVCHPFS